MEKRWRISFDYDLGAQGVDVEVLMTVPESVIRHVYPSPITVAEVVLWLRGRWMIDNLDRIIVERIAE
jgi:hypothetical protein